MAFDLQNYVDVPTRLAEAYKRWPNLRIQETVNETVTMPDGSCFIRCTITVWRDETDTLPAIATAAEPYPGKTPYTKNSEFMVGMTSALGRALGYMGCGVNKSIASRNEIEARQNPDDPGEVIAPRSEIQLAQRSSKHRVFHDNDMPGLTIPAIRSETCMIENSRQYCVIDRFVGELPNRTSSSDHGDQIR